MTISDATCVAALVVDLVALYFLIGIWKDDRAMRAASEESLKAQLEYLGLRRSWYAGRVKKREEKNVTQVAQLRPEDGVDPNCM